MMKLGLKRTAMKRSLTILDEVVTSFGADPALNLSNLIHDCAGTTPNPSPNPKKNKKENWEELCRAVPARQEMDLLGLSKVGKLEGNVLSYSCCKGEFWGRVVALRRYSWGVFGGGRDARFLCRTARPSNVGMRSTKRGSCALRNAFFIVCAFDTGDQILQPV